MIVKRHNYKPPFDLKNCSGCGRDTNDPRCLCKYCGGKDYIVPYSDDRRKENLTGDHTMKFKVLFLILMCFTVLGCESLVYNLDPQPTQVDQPLITPKGEAVVGLLDVVNPLWGAIGGLGLTLAGSARKHSKDGKKLRAEKELRVRYAKGVEASEEVVGILKRGMEDEWADEWVEAKSILRRAEVDGAINGDKVNAIDLTI